jgi:hypothetical protein
MVEARGTGMALFTLRAADEVRAAQLPSAEGELDPEMVAIARAIIVRRTDKFDPSTYRDRYQEALRALIEAKMKGLPIKPPSRKKRPQRAQGATEEGEPRRLLIDASRHCFYRCRVAEGRGKSLLSSINDARRFERRQLARLRRRMTTVPMPFVPSPV